MRFALPLILFLTITAHTHAETYSCDDEFFEIEATNTELAVRTCKSASRARQVLASCGVHLKNPLSIAVVETIEGTTGSCLGLYHCGDRRIEVLSPQAMKTARDNDGAFSRISDHALWDSVIAHELTHAAYQRVNCPFPSCIATSEYAAFAMQVRSLPSEELERFGRSEPPKTKPTRDAISATMYLMAPDLFAELAWRHFDSRPDQCTYMEWIMTGNIFFDRERP